MLASLLKSHSIIYDCPTADWIHVNFESSGFYRVHYCETLKSLIPADHLSETDRLQFHDDFYQLCKLGHEPISRYFNMLSEYYSKESSNQVLSTIIDNLSEMIRLFSELGKDKEDIISFSVNFLKNNENSNSEDLKTERWNLLAVQIAPENTDQDILNQAKILFKNYHDDSNSVRSDDLRTIFTIVAANSDDQGNEIDKLINLWQKNSKNLVIQDMIQESLGYSKNPTSIIKSFNSFLPKRPFLPEMGHIQTCK